MAGTLNVTTADQVNTIIAAGRADLVALARPHLVDPHFTLRASAHYGFEGQWWPKSYLAGKDQAMRLFERTNAGMRICGAHARSRPTGRRHADPPNEENAEREDAANARPRRAQVGCAMLRVRTVAVTWRTATRAGVASTAKLFPLVRRRHPRAPGRQRL
jgi:hypothetical protein